MLKELKDIWEYVLSKRSNDDKDFQFEELDWKINIFFLIFDWDKISNKIDFEEWDITKLKRMCFYTDKYWAIIPNVKIMKLWKNLSKLERFEEKYKFHPWKWSRELINWLNNIEISLNRNIDNKPDLLKKLRDTMIVLYNNVEFKDYLANFPIKIIPKNHYILTIKILKDWKFIFLWDLPEIRQYYINQRSWYKAVFSSWYCHVCENQSDKIINFSLSKWIKFPHKFYTLDKPWFAYGLKDSNWYLSFWVCLSCYQKIDYWEQYFYKIIQRNVLWGKAYVFPSIPKFICNKNIIFETFEKYHEKNISKLENNLQFIQYVVKGDGWKPLSDFLGICANYWEEADKNMLFWNRLIKINFLFADKNNSEFKVKYLIKDVISTRLWKYYKSINGYNNTISWNQDNRLRQMEKDFYWYEIHRSEDIVGLSLYPTYEKKKYIWNLKEFFQTNGWNNAYYKLWQPAKGKNLEKDNGWNNAYYKFIDICLHDSKYNLDDFWSLVYKKLKQDFLKNYILSSEWKLRGSIWEIYLVYRYMNENNLLDIKIIKMENIKFESDNNGIKKIEMYFNQNNLFDSIDKVYVSLVWFYVKLFLKKQKKEINSIPFISNINFERLDYQWILKLLNKVRSNFNKYASKKFDYYPELYRIILDVSMNLNKKLKRDEIVYYFSIWMEILEWIYFKDDQTID